MTKDSQGRDIEEIWQTVQKLKLSELDMQIEDCSNISTDNCNLGNLLERVGIRILLQCHKNMGSYSLLKYLGQTYFLNAHTYEVVKNEGVQVTVPELTRNITR